MKVQNTGTHNVSIPGTQPGYSYRFQPGEIIEIDPGLIGFVNAEQSLKVIGLELSEPPTVVPSIERKITCELCGKQIKSKDAKYDDRVIKMHKGKYHKP